MNNPTRPQPEIDRRRLRLKRGGGGRSPSRRSSPSASRSNETNGMTTRSVGVTFGSEAARRGRHHCSGLPDFTGTSPAYTRRAGPGLWAGHRPSSAHALARPSRRRRFVQQTVGGSTGVKLQLARPRSLSPVMQEKAPRTGRRQRGAFECAGDGSSPDRRDPVVPSVHHCRCDGGDSAVRGCAGKPGLPESLTAARDGVLA
jgi:hypothetical protein